jgi:uncharacterized protein YjbI with pentapeptide repeats
MLHLLTLHIAAVLCGAAMAKTVASVSYTEAPLRVPDAPHVAALAAAWARPVQFDVMGVAMSASAKTVSRSPLLRAYVQEARRHHPGPVFIERHPDTFRSFLEFLALGTGGGEKLYNELGFWKVPRNAVTDMCSSSWLRGFDLAGANYSRCGTIIKNFNGANLTGADFSYTDVVHSKFDGALLEGVQFPRRIDTSSFRNASLRGVDLSRTSIGQADFSGVVFANVTMCNFSANRGDWASSTFSGADLRGLDLSACYFSKVDFRGAKLDGAILPSMGDTNLSGLNLTNVRFSKGSTLIDVDLSHSDLRGVDFRDVTLRSKIQFAHADLSGAQFPSSSFDFKGNFSHANMSGVNLEGKRLNFWSFDHADLSGANLRNSRNARLVNVTLRNADLTGARSFIGPTNCDLRGVKMSGNPAAYAKDNKV